MSVLEFLKGTGIPVFGLDRQMQMANGLFDYPLRLFYPGIEEASGTFGYGPRCDITLPAFSNGRLLEEYLQKRFPFLKPPPAGKLRPVYFNCPGFAYNNPLTGSKKNVPQIHAVLGFLLDLTKETGIKPENIRLLTPYRFNLEILNRQLAKNDTYAALAKGIRAGRTEADSFQGQEGDVVVVYLTRECSKEKRLE